MATAPIEVISCELSVQAGGLSGTFSGKATFHHLDENVPEILAYDESGTFVPLESSLESRETRNRLLYDFSSPHSAEVFYGSLSEYGGDIEQTLAAAQHLYTLQSQEPGRLSLEQHDDGADMYVCAIDVEAPHAFISTWRVTGPTQDGEIISLFKRQAES